jgi:hypothetical protein
MEFPILAIALQSLLGLYRPTLYGERLAGLYHVVLFVGVESFV